MILPIADGGIVQQIVEHGAVLHVVAVDDQIVAQSGGTAFIQVRNAIIAVCLIKAMLQIEVGGINGLHNGIIDIGAINADPADEIAVFLIQCFVLGIGVLSFLQFRIKGLCGFAGGIEIRFGAGSVIDRFGGHDDQVFQFVEGVSRGSGILGLVDADAACHNSNQQECGNQREIKVFGFH